MNKSLIGNYYLLFIKLPIDSQLWEKFPIELSPGIYLDNTPCHAIAQGARKGAKIEEHVGLGAWVYPGYGLGMGMCHACIRVDASLPLDVKQQYAWIMAGALYLAKPIHIHIAGSFEYGTTDDGLLGRQPNHINHRSNVCLESFFTHRDDKFIAQYEEEDLKQAGKYFDLILKIFAEKEKSPRPFFIIRSFFQAALWEKFLYASSTFSKLFPIIDSLSGNPSHKHSRLTAERIGAFLANTPSCVVNSNFSNEYISQRLKNIWDKHRGPDLHGYIKEVLTPRPETPINSGTSHEIKDLFDLMEISRVAVLKMLMLEPEASEEYNNMLIPSYLDSKDINQNTRNEQAKNFFLKSYINPVDLYFFTDLAEATSRISFRE